MVSFVAHANYLLLLLFVHQSSFQTDFPRKPQENTWNTLLNCIKQYFSRLLITWKCYMPLLWTLTLVLAVAVSILMGHLTVGARPVTWWLLAAGRPHTRRRMDAQEGTKWTKLYFSEKRQVDKGINAQTQLSKYTVKTLKSICNMLWMNN